MALKSRLIFLTQGLGNGRQAFCHLAVPLPQAQGCPEEFLISLATEGLILQQSTEAKQFYQELALCQLEGTGMQSKVR